MTDGQTTSIYQGRLLFSLRMLKYFFCWMMLWQGNMVSGSLFQLNELFPPLPYFSMAEVFAVLIGFVVLFERSVTKDFHIGRSYFTGPLLLVAIAFFISWCRGSYITQRYTAVLEGHEAFALPIAFFVISNAFRDPEDRETLFKLLWLAAIAKCLDGLSVYFFSHDVRRFWGVIELWRDTYLLAVGIMSVFVFFHYQGDALRRMKRLMMVAFPLMVGVLVLSFRRTAMVAIVCSTFLMFLTLPRERRRRHLYVPIGFFLFFGLFIMLTDPVSVLMRLSGIVDPAHEGSAYIRVMELPNVLENIKRNPIFGTAVGVPWTTYFRMPISADYTTLGTHNSYLYWPLRAGVLGLIGFWGFFVRAWKAAIISYRLRKNEEDFLYGQLVLQFLTIYTFCSFFGLMYGDYMSSMMAVILTIIQLQSRHVTGRSSFRQVAFWATLREGRLCFTNRALKRAAKFSPSKELALKV